MPASALPLPAEKVVARPVVGPDTIQVAAGILLDCPILGVEPVSGGGNNRVFRVRTGDGDVALKFYPGQDEDPRDRLGVETSALRFLERYSVSSVPQVIAECRESGFAAFTWIEGAQAHDSVGERDIDSALRLIAELRALVDAQGADHLPHASAAVLSGSDAVAQIETRLVRLKEVAPAHPELTRFLREEFVPVHADVIRWARAVYDEAGIPFAKQIGRGQRTLSPSDFGFHNARRRPDGRVVFHDFEYFGWDDPAKLTSDFLLHPGMNLSADLRRRFLTGARAIFGDREGVFASRFQALYPLLALCWCLIVLNEYLPERWARRSLGANGASAAEAQSRQLARARARLQHIAETYESGPDLG